MTGEEGFAYWASCYGHLEILEELLKVGAEVNQCLIHEYDDEFSDEEDHIEETDSPLHVAASKGFSKIVKCLLRNGANVNAVNHNYTPLHNAAEKGHLKIVKLLLEFGAEIDADINRKGFTPLFMASVKGTSKKVVKYLLKCGANPNITNDFGDTLIHQISYNHCIKRRDLNNFNEDEDVFDTPRLDFIPMLIAHGADFKARNGGNITALDVAITAKNRRLAKVLVPFYCPETKIFNSIYPLDKFLK